MVAYDQGGGFEALQALGDWAAVGPVRVDHNVITVRVPNLERVDLRDGF